MEEENGEIELSFNSGDLVRFIGQPVRYPLHYYSSRFRLNSRSQFENQAIDHVGSIQPQNLDVVSMYSEHLTEILNEYLRNLESNIDLEQKRLDKINNEFFKKIKDKIKYSKNGITIDGEMIDNVGAATVIGNMVISLFNESVEDIDKPSENAKDFFKI